MIPFSMNKTGIIKTVSLPYRKLQYIEANGTVNAQYIDTGYVPDRLKTSFNIKLKIDFSDDITAFFGVAGSAENYMIADGTTNFIAMQFYGVNSGAVSFFRGKTLTPEMTAWHTYKITPGTTQMDDEGIVSYTPRTDTITSNFRIGSVWTGANVPRKIAYCTIWDDGVKVRDYIPVLWNANTPYTDGNTGATVTPLSAKSGMYDKVGKKLYVNRGVGSDFSYA